jgi:hypothetical protein
MKLLKRPLIQVVNNHLSEYPTSIKLNNGIYIVTIFLFFLFISSEISLCEELASTFIDPSEGDLDEMSNLVDLDPESLCVGFLAGALFSMLYMTCVLWAYSK